MLAVMPTDFSPDTPLSAIPIEIVEQVEWVRWANNDTVLFATSEPNQDPFIDDTIYLRTHLYALRADMSAIMRLDREPSNRGRRAHRRPQFMAQVVDFLPEDPDHILLAQNWRRSDTFDLIRTNIRTADSEIILQDRNGTRDFITDRQAIVRLIWGYPNGNADRDRFVEVRTDADADWTDISTFFAADHDFFPLGFGTNPSTLYVASNHDADTLGLFTFDINAGAIRELVFRHPEFDIEGLIRDSTTDEVVGVTYIADERERVFFDPRYEGVTDRLARQTGANDIGIVGTATESGRFLISASSHSDPGSLYVANLDGRQPQRIGYRLPGLANAAMGSPFAITIPARDGLTLPGVITLPHGYTSLDQAQQLPFILLIHGGPAARDFKRFDYQVQFLASRGYGVLQVNFRGSTGFGRSFESAGEGEWGRGMQNDIDDAARWLVAEGLADPSRIAAMGTSYGGYSALLAATRDNGLYAGAISINGVTDLHGMLRYSENFVGLERRIRRMLEGVNLRRASPANNTQNISIPVLVLHSEWDEVVPIDQFEHFQRRLRTPPPGTVFRRIAADGHSIQRFRNRMVVLANIEVFLHDNMPSQELLEAYRHAEN
ncbi:alpha/beta hydrolase family protein [Hyphobacterium sp.]|uniref:alpha/beta hydrolase family protein n=1 Tax=Hyphobacterium sp. TaxID=2004662 RepID=UPI003BA8D4BC